ncbi:AMP-binding protein [Kribbella sp. CWNU-51]
MKNLRARLAADPAIGAGNVLARVIEHGADPDGPGLTFDTAVDHFPAEHPLTLGELDDRVQARTAWLHEHGIGRRDVVAIWATEAVDIVLSFLALTRVGAIPALLNGKMAPAIADEYIRRLRVTASWPTRPIVRSCRPRSSRSRRSSVPVIRRRHLSTTGTTATTRS